ncbi:MAG: DUF3375 domain-containing protein [Myxococcota bacterium]
MDYRFLDTLRRTHPAWRLLLADHAPLIASVLFKSFIEPNVRTHSQPQLESLLDDHLHALRAELGDGAFPKTAKQYLEDWASDDRGWLRKYYPAGSDVPHFDLTTGAERAIEWLSSLRQRQLVSTESRLMMVFELLRQMAEGTMVDPEERVAELERRKAKLEQEIELVREGRWQVMDPAQVKDRFLQMAATARGLLSDFREVDQNFRDLDRGVRERIAVWEAGKGALLEQIFGERDAIGDSDQGKSFRAFWDFLMSPERQDELSSLLERVWALEPVRALQPDRRLLRIHYDWLAAGEVAQRTVARLSSQLRRYLDDQVWLENRRIMQLIRDVEQHALALREAPPEGSFATIDEACPALSLPMDRPMFRPPLRPRISAEALRAGDESATADALFEQVHVDKARLQALIGRALQTRSQISLAELLDLHPLEQGLAELVAYLSLAADSDSAVIDDSRSHVVCFVDSSARRREATLPVVVFGRERAIRLRPAGGTA